MSARIQLWFGCLSGLALILLAGTVPALAQNEASDQLAALIARVESRYARTDFTVQFTQASTLKAMEITETASGRLMVKTPGKMRWEYQTPESQLIITDGENLWIHRPLDNQVMIGRAPALFGNGKGAGFLSDIRSLKESFTITLGSAADNARPVLKLVPRNETPDLAAAFLTIDPATGEVVRILSTDHYEDETSIELTNYDFITPLSDGLFLFEIPEEADILRLGE